jgi:hypothetical protein
MGKKHLTPVAATVGATLVWSELFGQNLPHIHALPPVNTFPMWGAQSIYAGTSSGTWVSASFNKPGVSP